MFQAVGKLGRQRSCQWKEPTANEWDNGAAAAVVWRDDALGCLVDAAAARLCRIIDFYRLFDVGGISGKRLFFWQLHLPFLFARTFWRFTAQLVWAEAELVAGLAYFLACAPCSLGAGGISRHLLLLSRRLLQSVLGGPAGVHGGRAAEELLG